VLSGKIKQITTVFSYAKENFNYFKGKLDKIDKEKQISGCLKSEDLKNLLEEKYNIS
jgi:hypothetical protein